MEPFHQIRGVFTHNWIQVYQAYSPVIAQEAVERGQFGPHFKMDRMTWIKPSFLWMMYRCGWAQKKGQERVLAIRLRRDAFDQLVRQAVPSSYSGQSGWTYEEWKERVQTSQVRCQWDPERDLNGNPLPYRSLQLGLRREAVYGYVHDWTVSIEDLTDYVRELDLRRQKGENIASLLPQERPYPLECLP